MEEAQTAIIKKEFEIRRGRKTALAKEGEDVEVDFLLLLLLHNLRDEEESPCSFPPLPKGLLFGPNEGGRRRGV